MPRRIHMCTSIEGLERLPDRELKKIAPFAMVDGAPLETAAQVRKMLREAKENGLKYIPCPECDNYNAEGFCMGHEIKEDVNENA